MISDIKKTCQSCGMPLRGITDFGSDADGSKSDEYCHFCFEKGAFKDEGITLEQKIEKNISLAIKMGMAPEKANKLANSIIPELKRWKRNK